MASKGSAVWARVKFGEIAQCVNDRVDDPKAAGVDRYVGLEHLDPESLSIRRWGTPDEVESTKLRFKRGDIIFGKRRAYQRKVAVADFEGICSAHAMVLRAKPDAIVPEFLPFLMQSDLFMERAIAISAGSLSPTINWRALAVEEFMLPPLREQRRIATKLNSLVEMLDALEGARAAAQRLSEAFLNSMVSESASNRAVLRDVCSLIVDCKNRTPPYVDKPGYPVIRTSNIRDGRLITDELLHTSNDGYRVWTERAVPLPGDLVFTREAPIGQACLVPEGMTPCLGQRTMLFRANRAVLQPEFLLMAVLSPPIQRQLLQFAGGSTVGHVRVEAMKSLQIPVPSLEIQRERAAEFEAIRSSLVRLDARLAMTNKLKASALSDGLAS